MPWGRRMRTDTWPDGPPGAVVSSMSMVGLLTGPDWSASMVLRPWSGPSSNKKGGLALASTTALACGSRATGGGHDCLLLRGLRSLGGRPRDQGSPSPPASTPLGLPPPVCGLSGQLRCSASRSTAVVVPLPGQLPGHGKPGVGLGELQLSAPQVLLDVEVGPALLSIDLVVECLAMGQRLVTALHGVVPGQLPPFRHGSPPSPGPSGPSRPESPLPRGGCH